MRSSTGQHFVALDHVRGLAALMVVTWHFTHARHGYPVPFGAAPLLAPLDEGHVGVSLFMTLSGFLFAKLLDGKEIGIRPFLWNRFLRLAPLFALVLLFAGLRYCWNGGNAADYLAGLAIGLVLPTLPNGGWSITTEMHFYLLLPFLLVLARRWSFSLPTIAALTLGYRACLYLEGADIQFLAYHTIIGRLDQFLLGMFAFQHRQAVGGRAAAIVAVLFLVSYSLFDLAGGYYGAARSWWIVLPLWEASCFAALIAWYDRHPLPAGLFSTALQKAGEYSYSIYLLHFFFYAAAARLVQVHLMDISSFYRALPWAIAYFALMALVGHFTFRWIERPFLAFRRPYQIDPAARAACGGPAAAGAPAR